MVQKKSEHGLFTVSKNRVCIYGTSFTSKVVLNDTQHCSKISLHTIIHILTAAAIRVMIAS